MAAKRAIIEVFRITGYVRVTNVGGIRDYGVDDGSGYSDNV